MPILFGMFSPIHLLLFGCLHNNTVCKHIHLVHMYTNKDVNNAQVRGYDEGCDREHLKKLASYNNSETICIDKIK